MSRPRVLFVAADLPWPPDGGGRIASLNVLESFARQFDVDLVALADPFRPVELDRLQRLCRRVEVVYHPFTFGRHRVRQTAVALRSLLSSEPYRLRKFRSPALRQVLDRWRASGNYDLEHFEQFGVTPYRRAGTPSTALVQNVESIIYARGRRRAGLLSRAWAMAEGGKLARREPEILRGFDAVFVLSPSDREALAAEGVRHITVVPMPAPPLRPVRMEPGPPTILSLGSMSWFGVAEGLAWFHDRVLPSLRARLPGLRWQLVGPGAPPAVRSFARDPRIDLAGYVEDLDPYVAAARVAIIPLHIAGGIRMKLLDLMAWGLPSVATEIGAQGLEFTDGEGCFRRDDPEAFGEAVHALLTDDALWQATVTAGQEYVARRHAPGNLDAAVAGGVAEAIAAHRRPAAG